MHDVANHVEENGLEFLVDGHVHMHAHFDVEQQLDAAASNFAAQAEHVNAGPGAEFVLCLTECQGVDRFADLVAAADQGLGTPGPGRSKWQFRHSGDNLSVVAEHRHRGRIVIVAGRQIVTSERLEVLGLGAVGQWPDGRSIRETIDSLMENDAVPVLPWGFGKWLGRRGRVARELIGEYRGSGLYLGDNSGRLGIAPDPEEFRLARLSDIGVLPGSDTLPFASEVHRTGSYGFHAHGVPNRGGAWASLQSALATGEIHCRAYGSLESPGRFVRNQVAMQYRIRVGG